MIVIIRKAYCCCSLRSGSCFIGVFDLISSILMCLSVGYMLHLAQNKNSRLARVYNLCLGLLIAGLLLYVGSILLIHGANRRSKCALVPFLFALPAVVITSITLLFSAVPTVPLVAVLITSIVGGVLSLYNWIVVFSYFSELHNNRKEGQGKKNDDQDGQD